MRWSFCAASCCTFFRIDSCAFGTSAFYPIGTALNASRERVGFSLVRCFRTFTIVPGLFFYVRRASPMLLRVLRGSTQSGHHLSLITLHDLPPMFVLPP
jgi:hypothetical protein